MNLITVTERFPTQESCIAHLERVRFGDEPFCPLCGTVGECARKREGSKIGRWNCHACKSSFNVLSKTMFQGTHLPLQKWFCAIALIVNAKKSLSSCQLGRDLNLNQGSAWYMQQRIRAEMATKQGRIRLTGLIEADEVYLGGRPRKRNKRNDDKPNLRGRGTRKTAVIGAVERSGKVVAQVADDLSAKGVLSFIKRAINPDASTLVTDEYGAYSAVRRIMDHCVIRHSERYVDGEIFTNTIEGVWSLLKRAWYGSHHHYTKQYTPLYVAEACFKYNHRKDDNAFDSFIGGCFV